MQISETSTVLAAGNNSASPTISGDFETFLKMLTTQIQNQDPLSPMDAESFASQLATFSMVEQQTLTNQSLSALINGQTSDLDRFIGIVGRTVSHEGGTYFSGKEVYFQLDRPISDSAATLDILDVEGEVVVSLALSNGQERVAWSGKTGDGSMVDAGLYSAILRDNSGKEISDFAVYSEAVVEEVRFKDGGAKFVLDNGVTVTEDQISALRQ